MKILGYEITIKKLAKEKAYTTFTDIEHSFRDIYEEDYWKYYVVSNATYGEIKRLAKKDCDFKTKDDKESIPSDEGISYYRFEIVKTKFYRRVLFRVALA